MIKATTETETISTLADEMMINMEPGRWLHDDRLTIIQSYGLHICEPETSFERAAKDLSEIAASMGVRISERATVRYLRAVVYDAWLDGQAELTLADLDQ